MIEKIKEQITLAIDFIAAAVLGMAVGCLFTSLIILSLIGQTIDERIEKRNAQSKQS